MSTHENKTIFRTALTTFLGCASIVFAISLIYSIVTNHTTAALLLGAAAVLIAILAVLLVKSEESHRV
jgi:hypothetical protein